jgi:hypothetical protein
MTALMAIAMMRLAIARFLSAEPLDMVQGDGLEMFWLGATRRPSARARWASRARSPTSSFPAGHVTDRLRASESTGGSSNKPAATPRMRLHCSANQAEPKSASFPASAKSLPIWRAGVRGHDSKL